MSSLLECGKSIKSEYVYHVYDMYGNDFETGKW